MTRIPVLPERSSYYADVSKKMVCSKTLCPRATAPFKCLSQSVRFALLTISDAYADGG